MTSYPFVAEASGIVEAPADVVFAFLDDQENLSSHMSKPSLMMLGTTMEIVMDADRTRSIGSRFGFSGSILGVPLKVDEVVTARNPPLSKTWETTDEPTLWVIGRYAMGFDLVRLGTRCELRVHIAYARAQGILGGLLSRLLGTSMQAGAHVEW
jgi:hypothetical protein